MSKISIKNIAQAIDLETENKTSAELPHFLKKIVTFLNNKKLLSQSENILKELEKIIDKKESRLRMRVKSAFSLSEHKKRELEHEIKEKYKVKHIESTYIEDRNLLGGMKIETGEEVIDTTYRNKLNQLEKHLISKQ